MKKVKRILALAVSAAISLSLCVNVFAAGAEQKTDDPRFEKGIKAAQNGYLMAGYGDGVALLILGMISGAGKSLMIFGFSLFLAAVFSVVMLVLGKAGRNTAIPFLPFLAAAWLAVMI